VILLLYPPKLITETPQYINSYLDNSVQEPGHILSWKKSRKSESFVLRDQGNPFFTRYLEDHHEHWSKWCGEHSVAPRVRNQPHYYCEELVDILHATPNNASVKQGVILIWASRRSLQSFKINIQNIRRGLRSPAEHVSVEPGFRSSNEIKGLRTYRDQLLRIDRRIKNCEDRLRIACHTLTSSNAPGILPLTMEAGGLLSQLSSLKQELPDLIQKIERRVSDEFMTLQIELTRTQLRESRISLRQNSTVKRLTVLAFIFIPISTVSSVFGMNIKEFIGDPGPRVWTFIVAVAITLVFAICIAAQDSIWDIGESIMALSRRLWSFGHARPRNYWALGPALALGGLILAIDIAIWPLYQVVHGWRQLDQNAKHKRVQQQLKTLAVLGDHLEYDEKLQDSLTAASWKL
jgi:hypothetical protein